MAVRTQPVMSPGLSARVTEAMTLSPLSFRKRYRSSYEMQSPSSSLTIPIQKTYLGTSELVEDTKDENSDSDTKGEDTAADEPLGLGYVALRRCELALGEGSMPSTFEIGQSSRISRDKEQERATVTFGAIWRLVLALESWAGHVDTQRAEMWQARYDDHRFIHDLLV
ncbi:hypothetical protein Tco_0205899 [Tanacetum coccineum]